MPPNIVLAANNADDIVSIARGELGSTNYSKYYGGNKGAWCADFVSWCAQQAGVDSIAKSSSCYNMYIGMKNNGCQEVSSPQKGDIVFFYCTKCSSTAGKWCHVGIMEDSTYSIEGNRWSNGVSKVERGNSYSHNGDLGYKHRDGIVRKYLRPKYSFPNPVTTTPSIWKNSDSYTVGNSATLTWNSVDNATGYWFSVWYKGEQIVTTQVSGSSEYTLNNLGEGEYTAYITAYNDSSSKQGYVTFRVNYLDIGTNFIANIIKVDSWSHVVNDNTNACIGKEVGNANEYYEFVRQSDGSYIIKSLEDGKYLEVSDGGNKNGQNVGFSDYTGENNQRWYIKNGSSGKILIPKNATGSCLDISNNGSAVGTNAQIWAQAGVAAQEFSIYTQSNIPNFINFGDDFYANIIKASTWSTLVNKNPNLEVGGEGEAEGSDIWHFRRMKDGTYIIQSLFDGKYLDVEKFSNQKGANVYCYDYTGDSNQRWYLTLGKNGKVLIPKNATGLCLDVSNDGSDAGTNAQLWEPNGTTAQEFNVYKEDTIKLGTANLYLDDEESMPVSEYGSGVKSLTVIALHRMLAKLNNVSIILGIEEPETNLHPQAQKKFIASLKDKRQDCETQAIFATHSTVIVDALDHQDIVLVRREKDEKRGFHSSTSQLPVDFWTLHNIAELKHYNFFKYRNSDFFFAKYVVITESITDAQVIERLIEPQLGDLYYNVSVLNLDGVKNLQYPFFLLSDLGIPFTAVVDKDVFLPYKNGKLMDSRNSETFLPEYSNTLNRRNPVLNAVFNTEELKDKLEEYVNQSYTKFVNYIEKYNMLSMQYCLEMDLVATDKASELYYDHYNLLGEKRNRKSLLIERKDAIKDPTVLLEIFDRLNPSEYPFSFKKIKNILVKKIKTAIITQRQNMEVEE